MTKFRLSDAEKHALANVPDYILATLPAMADKMLILMRRRMAEAGGSAEGALSLTSFIVAVQMVINLTADDADIQTLVCEWIRAGRVRPPGGIS